MDRDPIVRLNWGCGPVLPRGWLNSDRWLWEHADGEQHHQGDILDGLPWRDGTFDGIVANHSLQCLTRSELHPALNELRRVLQPGGRIRILVPDVVAAFEAWQHGDADWPGFTAISEPWNLDAKLAHYLTWGGQNRSCFTRRSLLELLVWQGFSPVFDAEPEWGWLRALDSRGGESIAVEATW